MKTHRLPHRTRTLCVALSAALLALSSPTGAQTTLADQPVFSSISVPGNLALALSVEFPTAVSAAHTDGTYFSSSVYLGYFDPNKCYDYVYSNTEANRYFQPAGLASNRTCTGKWSGNFLNWATMQTIDPFRWALTGGYRTTDTTTTTIIEKANATGQGGTGNFGDRSLGNSTATSQSTPFNWSSFNMRVQGLGNKLRFTRSGNNYGNSITAYNPADGANVNGTYEVSVRVKVCDSSTAAGGIEANCKLYASGYYKPEGLIQQYADQIRFSAFGYLNDDALSRDGGVLRARQKFVGPTQPVPGSEPITNTLAEWNPTTGVMNTNPDPLDATATSTNYNITISNSGVMNYLNKFGQINTGSYKTYDPSGELYYAVLRYFKNQGNIPEWTNPNTTNTTTRAKYADGFPVITTWDDPIQYSCQKNFVLGIGDTNTHADRNIGDASTTQYEPTRPALSSGDNTFSVTAYTNKVGQLHGIGNYGNAIIGGNGRGGLIAGMAYYANTTDIRPDNPNIPKTDGMQTLQTYWLDVLEYSSYTYNNQYYLATKYGGFNVPGDYGNPLNRTGDINQAWWHTGPATDTVGSGSGAQLRPDNYFTAAKADQMVSGLASAFRSIASKMKSYSSSLATADLEFATAGEGNYATQFDANDWSGEVVAASATADAAGETNRSEAWRFSSTLATQAAGTGWNTGRNIVSWNTSTRRGVPFRIANLATAQTTPLDTAYRSGDDKSDYLNYLRGDRTHEQNSTATGSAKAYRNRSSLIGDIVNSKVTVVGPTVVGGYSESSNPGYNAYATANRNRENILLVGTNAGMLHVINGKLTGVGAGRELFAYVPGVAFTGPTNTPATNGLQALGNPNYVHRFFIDSPPVYSDVDLNRTNTSAVPASNDWRPIAVGGLGKGGKAIYALDLSGATSVSSETAAANKVMWEFTDTDLGYTFGTPIIAKTAQYGWVVIAASGYNNSNGRAYLYVLDAKTGALLQKVATPTTGTSAQVDDGTAANPTNLANIAAYYRDSMDGTVESVYGGDLKGNVWRFDLTAVTGAYPAAVKIARLTDNQGNAQPVTTKPVIGIDPKTYQRFIGIGTGRLLAANDINNSQAQRFYVIKDGNMASYNTAAMLNAASAGLTFPLATSNFRQLTSLTDGVTLAASDMGWYFNLGSGTAGSSFRVLVDPSYFQGIVAFAATVPSSTDACSAAGTSRVYAMSFADGVSKINNSNGYITTSYAVSDVKVVTVTTADGKKGIGIIIGGSGKGTGGAAAGQNLPTCPAGQIDYDGVCSIDYDGGTGSKFINWREIPLRN